MSAAAFRATVAGTIARYGEDVTVNYAAGGSVGPVRASVQAAVGVDTVNDYQQDSMFAYVPVGALALPPAKMDRVIIRGIERTIDEVRLERWGDLSLCYILVIR